MKHIVGYSISVALIALSFIYLGTVLGLSARKRADMSCTGLNVVIRDSVKNNFVTKTDVKDYIDTEFGTYIGSKAYGLDLNRIEEIIDGKSAVLKSEAYVTADGMLNIAVTQREPMIRFQRADGGFYADKDGFLFPLQRSYTARVPIVDGEIPIRVGNGYKGDVRGEKEKEWLKRMLALVKYMEDGKVWAEAIVQISVQPGGDIVLVPRHGKEKFIFGQPVKIEEKFKLMEYYYTGIEPHNQGVYSTVNVKYAGRIVCRK